MPDKKILRLAAAAIFVIGAVAFTAQAFDEPDGFRGVPWGATEEQMRAVVSVRGCNDIEAAERWNGDRSCYEKFDLAGMPVNAVYTFRGDRFVKVTLLFASRDFERIAAIFRERYGPPTDLKEEPFTTQGGLSATNQTAMWDGPTVAIRLRRFLSRITQGSGSLSLRKEVEESTRLRNEQTKGAAKGL
jgi:hypothetical protein